MDLQTPPQPPPSFRATPTSIALRVQSLIEAGNKVLDDIVSAVSPDTATFENVVLPLAHAENARRSESGIIRSFQTAVLDEALRNASRDAGEALDEFELQMWQRADVYRLVDAVRQSIEAKRLPEPDPEDGHFLDVIHREFFTNGLGLPAGPLRERFTSIQRRINSLSSEFLANVGRQTKGVWFTLEELEGVPDHAISAMERGTGDNEGKLFLTFSNDSGWVSAYATKAETRRRLHIARYNRCNDNIPIFKEVTLLRDEAARLLGYPSHAAMVLKGKMAGNTTTVHKLLDGLRDALVPEGRRVVETLGELKRCDLESRGEQWDGRVYQWDSSFYTQKISIKNRESSVDKTEISEYFPLQHAVDVMLETMGSLFGLVFSHMDKGSSTYNQDMVWHDDVQLFSVWNTEDEGGAFVGYLYLDPYVRDFNPASPTCRSLVPGYVRTDGSRWYPSTILFCPFRKPTATTPSLLSHHDATQLFHELGHGIHNLVARTAHARFHGCAGTVVDFGEAPSQLLENWLRVPSQLKRFSRHYATLSGDYLRHWQEKHKLATDVPEPETQLPDAAVARLLKALPLRRTLNYLGDVEISTWDMAIHDPPSRQSLEAMDFPEVYGRLQREISQLATPWHQGEGDGSTHPYTTFSHMICGDYHAGYYGYLLSEMYAMDIFETLFKDDMENKELGRRYRHGFLEMGGRRPEMETLLEFLGREPDPGPFYRFLGIA